ncbi:glutathione s-transferase [Stylonychia lemnae]|uniref:Glutathione s-transferase n=1 Tax=Stylonychia lemnae TaxID=5949 RepID=A0A077ZSQ6_STYLE|nr:glutathione s-transferase [Stylonychia lemnae]|eukprot:CDW72912.1 glutathione s-transferase [Stylonychia lemnae]
MKLHYFNFYGRAESVRMLLHHAKVPFTECPITYQDWPKIKSSGLCEFEQIPVLETDGKRLTQNKAILRYLGVQHGYTPKDPYQAYLCDSMLDSIDDVSPHFVIARKETDPRLQAAYYEKIFTQVFPRWCAAVEKRLQQNVTRKFLVGEALTIADFAFAGRHFAIVKNPQSTVGENLQKIYNQHEGLKEYEASLEQELRPYLEKRPQYPF